ncbi:MAG TPA: ATP-binding protein, partial [Rhodoferax sp.]|nr:ATP-binding protein [Rhodoferax sp.]
MDAPGSYRRFDGSIMDIRKHVRKSGQQCEFYAVRARPMRGTQRYEPEITDIGLHLAATLEATEDCLVLTDNEGSILNMNRRFSQLWPLPQELLVERDDRGIVVFIDGLLRDEPGQSHQFTMLQQVIELQTEPHGNTFETLTLKDNRVIECFSHPARNHDRTIGRVFCFRDVTERIQYETSLKEARDKAEMAMRGKAQFLANMSHEIRTPMNGILGMAQMLLQPNLQEEQRNDYARTVLSSGQTLLALLNDILDLSKIEAGKFQIESTAFAPEALMHETINLFAGAAQTKGLELDCQWHGASDQRYLADSHRLRQMLSNLVGNAIKFTRSGQVRIEARALERTEGTSVLEFAVSDTGIGIPAHKLDLLFKPFSQTDSSTTREFGGSGLGLSIVSHLVKAMGGETGVSSELGQGSRFWFRVKVQNIAENRNSRKSERLPLDTNSDNVTTVLQGHVLVVEDNLVNCMVIESLLNSVGLIVSVVHDGQKAVELIEHHDGGANADTPTRPDLILMDLHMPVMDGYTATERIRQWEVSIQHSPLPIIALTADAYEEDRQHCLAIGMNDFLCKPIALDELKIALARWLPAGTAAQAVNPGPKTLKPLD